MERLTEVDVPGAPSRDESYQLAEEGNRLSSHLSQTHVTDRANRLLSDDDYTYVYDLNGNLIGKRAKRAGLPDWDAESGQSIWGIDCSKAREGYARTKHLSGKDKSLPSRLAPNSIHRIEFDGKYDDLDLLISVTKDGEVVERYRYDALGRRSLIETSDGAGGFTATGLINDGSDWVIDIANDNSPQRRYTHGDNVDEQLLLQTFDGAEQVAESYNYHTDHLGSVRYVTDSSRVVVNAYEYDSYGRPIDACNTAKLSLNIKQRGEQSLS